MSPVYCLLVSVVLPRDAMLAAADRQLAGLCEYSVPGGGMFLWMRVPGLSSTWDMIMKVSRAASREDFTIKEKAPTSSSIRAFSVITKLRVDLRLKLYSSRSAASRGTSCWCRAAPSSRTPASPASTCGQPSASPPRTSSTWPWSGWPASSGRSYSASSEETWGPNKLCMQNRIEIKIPFSHLLICKIKNHVNKKLFIWHYLTSNNNITARVLLHFKINKTTIGLLNIINFEQ